MNQIHCSYWLPPQPPRCCLPARRSLSLQAETQEDECTLCRDPAFITFVLTAAHRQLAACEASELTAAIATGTGGLHGRVGGAVLQQEQAYGWEGLLRGRARG